MCGSQGSVPRRTGYCQENERCTGTNDINQGVDLIDKSQLCSLANICYCEHPNERAPLNGIMCGDPTRGNYKRTGYCQSNERCTGPTDPNQGIDANLKKQLCNVMYFKRENTRCKLHSVYTKDYPSLSEAKSECSKQSDCEMVEEAMRKNGWVDEKDWLASPPPTWIGPFFRTCRGAIYQGTYTWNPYPNVNIKTGTIWLKDGVQKS